MLDDVSTGPATSAASVKRASRAKMPERDLPMPVMAMPVPIASAVLFLVSSDSSFIASVSPAVDGSVALA